MSEAIAKRLSVTAVIPVWNEIDAIETGLRSVDTYLKSSDLDYEIIVVESGSTDGTYEKCCALAKELTAVRIISEGSRNGFGAALQLGFSAATKELLWPIPVDLPFKLELIEVAASLIQSGNDAVISYRTNDDRSTYRKMQSRTFNCICRTLLGLRVRGVNSAFKVIRCEFVKQLEIMSRGWTFDAELLYRLKQAGARVTEIPAELVDRKAGKSTVGLLDPVWVLLQLIQLRLGLLK